MVGMEIYAFTATCTRTVYYIQKQQVNNIYVLKTRRCVAWTVIFQFAAFRRMDLASEPLVVLFAAALQENLQGLASRRGRFRLIEGPGCCCCCGLSLCSFHAVL